MLNSKINYFPLISSQLSHATKNRRKNFVPTTFDLHELFFLRSLEIIIIGESRPVLFSVVGINFGKHFALLLSSRLVKSFFTTQI